MVDSNQFVTDLTTIGGGTAHMIGYAQNAGAGYIEAPNNTQQADGVVPLDRLPAQWWNWFLNQATRRFSEYETYVENIVAELDGVLDILGITPDAGDPSTVNQLKTMFASHYLQDYLPEVIAAASSFSADATHENHILVADDDGNSGFSVKKVPYAPGFILNTQLGSAAKTLTLPANCPFDGETIKICFANGHEAANSTDYMTLNVNSNGPVPIVSNQNGTLANLPIHELTAGTYSVLMANVTLEMYYTSNGFNSNPAWVVIGNPVVLSSTDYTIYADGSNGDMTPVGTIIGLYKKTDPYGYLYLDGSVISNMSTKYPRLYAYLGGNTLPDYREFALVGAEQNTTDGNISADSHDVYVAGQSKNDCSQRIEGSFMLNTSESFAAYPRPVDVSGAFYGDGNNNYAAINTGDVLSTYGPSAIWTKFDSGRVTRASTVTRGKRKAVFWYMKY